MLDNKKGTSFGTVVAVLGSILIISGIAWLVAQNWHQMHPIIKIVVLLGATAIAYVSGSLLRARNYPGIGKALLVLGALLYTLSIFLIAQIYSTSTSLQGMAYLWLLAWVGVAIASYIFGSGASLSIALLEFIIWLVIQFFAFVASSGRSSSVPGGLLAFYLLAAGILLYGLSLIHRTNQHEFTRVYSSWTAFYFLAFSYMLSFQFVLPYLWPKNVEYSIPALVFFFVLVLFALVSLIGGAIKALNDNSVENKELSGFFFIFLVLLVLILSTFLLRDISPGGLFGFGRASSVPMILWAVWIFSNLIFLGVILSIIGYGTWKKIPEMVNLGIFYFGLDVATRYLGFVIDLWGYTSLSIIFISGGIILLVGGWGIEKWRRNLIAKVR